MIFMALSRASTSPRISLGCVQGCGDAVDGRSVTDDESGVQVGVFADVLGEHDGVHAQDVIDAGALRLIRPAGHIVGDDLQDLQPRVGPAAPEPIVGEYLVTVQHRVEQGFLRAEVVELPGL
jgi:hypothetical protein